MCRSKTVIGCRKRWRELLAAYRQSYFDSYRYCKPTLRAANRQGNQTGFARSSFIVANAHGDQTRSTTVIFRLHAAESCVVPSRTVRFPVASRRDFQRDQTTRKAKLNDFTREIVRCGRLERSAA